MYTVCLGWSEECTIQGYSKDPFAFSHPCTSPHITHPPSPTPPPPPTAPFSVDPLSGNLVLMQTIDLRIAIVTLCLLWYSEQVLHCMWLLLCTNRVKTHIIYRIVCLKRSVFVALRHLRVLARFLLRALLANCTLVLADHTLQSRQLIFRLVRTRKYTLATLMLALATRTLSLARLRSLDLLASALVLARASAPRSCFSLV